jgi:hypothetical protein
MTKEKTDVRMWLGVAGFIVTAFFAFYLDADEMVHKFKSPSFSGIGVSAHYLTIENQETSRRQAIKAEIKAYQEDLAREADAQLSRQLVDNLFGETANQSGILKLEGNTIEYTTDGEYITLIITDAEGNTTEITLPIGDFSF